MTTLENKKLITAIPRNQPSQSETTKSHIRNAVHFCKVYKNGDTNRDVFEKIVINEIYTPLKEKGISSLIEEIQIENQDLAYAELSSTEYLITLRTIADILIELVSFSIVPNEKYDYSTPPIILNPHLLK